MIAAPFVSRAILYATFAAALLGALGMQKTHGMAAAIGSQAAPTAQPIHANI
jgi:hypothetical protein